VQLNRNNDSLISKIWRAELGRNAKVPVEASTSGWPRSRTGTSLSEVFGTIATRPTGSTWSKLVAFLGPGYLVAVLSQVILSLQLPFAVVPLVRFTADRKKLGALVAPRWLTFAAGITAATIIALNVKLIVDQIVG
jgi:hypothetical protein